ncbi:hypothetical protein Dimus_013147 [Dionaea muscipula]
MLRALPFLFPLYIATGCPIFLFVLVDLPIKGEYAGSWWSLVPMAGSHPSCILKFSSSKLSFESDPYHLALVLSNWYAASLCIFYWILINVLHCSLFEVGHIGQHFDHGVKFPARRIKPSKRVCYEDFDALNYIRKVNGTSAIFPSNVSSINVPKLQMDHGVANAAFALYPSTEFIMDIIIEVDLSI